MNRKKKILMFLFLGVIAMMTLIACAQDGGGIGISGYSSDERCVWCGATPTKQIASKTNPEYEAQYYCEECSTTCFLDSNPAVDHFTNLYGIETFVCEDDLDY